MPRKTDSPRLAKNVRLPQELWERVDETAKQRGCTRTELIEAGVHLALADPPEDRSERARRALSIPGQRPAASWMTRRYET